MDGSLDGSVLSDAGAQDGSALDSGPVDTGVIPITIPDPGPAMDDWGNSVVNACCSTPAQAYPTGTVTQPAGYVQGNIDPSTGDFFYVFRAGPALTQLTWNGTPIPGLDLVDLHDGDGRVFGAVLPDTDVSPTSGAWTLIPNRIYVLHLHSTAPGFF